MKKILAILITIFTSVGFIRGTCIAVGVGIASGVKGQLTPKTILMVKPDGTGFYLSTIYLAPVDTNTCIMTYAHAQTSIDAINASIATNTGNITLKKNITDSGRDISNYTTGYDLNKVRDSVQANIPTNNNQLTNGAAYLTAVPAQSFASLTGKPTTLSGYGITDAYPLSGNPSAFLTSITSGNVTTALGFIPVTNARTISTTSPLTGGGDLSANRTFAITNAAADNSTKGAASFDSSYFNDNGSGIISWAVTSGTGTVSGGAVTINQPRGKITLSSPSIIAAATLSITLTNSFITSTSIIGVGINGNGSNLTLGTNCYIKSQTAGSCVINILNLSLLSTFTTSLIIDFFIVN